MGEPRRASCPNAIAVADPAPDNPGRGGHARRALARGGLAV